MGLFNTFFRASEQANEKTLEGRQSWTWVHRTRAGAVTQAAHRTNPSLKQASNEQGTIRTGTADDGHYSKEHHVNEPESNPTSAGSLEQALTSGDSDPSSNYSCLKTDSQQAFTESQHPVAGSKGFAGFMTSLRSRKPRHRKSLMRLGGRSQHNDCTLHGARTNCICISSRENSAIDKDADEHQESRKASDKTLESVNSNLTAETVFRHPSRNTSNPIPLIEREHVYDNHFDEVEESPQLVAVSNPFTDRFKAASRSSRDSSSIYSLTDSQKPQNLHVYKRSRRPVICTDLDIMGSLSRESSLPLSCLDDGNWSDIFDRRKATIAFNDLAIKLSLKPLPLSNPKRQGGGDCSHAHPTSVSRPCDFARELPRRRDRIIRRIRSVRSTFHLKAQSMPQERKLRRMKTFANLSYYSYRMDSLAGKSLETLARLGGHSFLAYPGDFAPTALKLPVCFVATATYLRCRGPLVQDLFFDPGDLVAAAQIYGYFASQVLSTEREQDKIQITMGSGEMPSELMSILSSIQSQRHSTHILSVGWVFKCLLAGLPGGILGSTHLYNALLDIYIKTPSLEDKLNSPNQKLKRTRSCLGGLTQARYTRIKAIGLAILALAGPMQLELMCAVFGLCAFYVHETRRIVEYERHGYKTGVGKLEFVTRSQILEGLGQVFGPLLTDRGPEEGAYDLETLRILEMNRTYVAMMLIANWRAVSRQLRVWEDQVHVPQRLTISWSSEGSE
ncbi:uncharacterized protein NFIA_074110 [Aspergillus fischeri NRRL 181]|uniref:Uncharacterized protein n=1 Tax=Neosartorya fischeri (strain ATCC 1020 / DSM 3700 / CBS 544.65 / FGSC A1164 / JCM 1740 / NRRL 181 / WB 181) TaxID=331117 RepID=A1DDN8_NEOFI|nr:conserved hypothetical protein [Aspergillus fischeri NRRL 181]EAW17495.1 conserved hypothetical protein [Aspergillus fischeri NRRL 181]KAG2025417.1 hypothetical protein GB937_002668 [Aspergillus fischeri]